MEKKVSRIEIEEFQIKKDSYRGTSIDDLIKELTELKEKGATIIDFYGVYDKWGESVYEVDFTAYKIVEESDEEFAERIAKETQEAEEVRKQALKIIEDNERALYEQLKRKFDGQ